MRGAASSAVTAAIAFIGLGLGPTTIAVVLEQLTFARERVDLAILVTGLPLCLLAAALVYMALHLHRREIRNMRDNSAKKTTVNLTSTESEL